MACVCCGALSPPWSFSSATLLSESNLSVHLASLLPQRWSNQTVDFRKREQRPSCPVGSLCLLLAFPSALQAPGFATSVAPHPHLMSWELLPECFWQPRGSDIRYKSFPRQPLSSQKMGGIGAGKMGQRVKTPATMPNYLG